MAQTPALLQRAKERTSGFKKPDIAGFIPPELRDAVDRIVAAGKKLMFAPETRQQLMQEVQRDVPPPQKMAEAISGLMLTLDQKSQGGLPVGAIFPAAMELLGDAAEVLTAAGQQVTQDDYNQAAQLMFVILGRKLGATDDQLMQTAQQAQAGQGGMENEPGEGPAHEQAEAPGMERQEDMAEGEMA